MSDAVIQKGTPREKRDVVQNKEWLEARIEHLIDKEAVFSERRKKVMKERKIREQQLANL